MTVRILVIALAAYLLLPQLAGLEASGRALTHTRWWLPPLVLVLEAASLLAYAELVRVVLAAGGRRERRGLVQRATAAGYALGRTLPGGSLAALAMISARLGDLGIPPATTAAAMAASGLLSAVVLALLLPVAALLALAGGQGASAALGVAGLAVLVVLAALALGPTLRRPAALGRVAERVVAVLARGPLRRRLDPAAIGAQVAQAAQGLKELASEPGTLAQAAGWAAANWLLDMAVLATITATLGSGVALWGVPLAYVLGQWTASLPLTPGGVGLVESATIAALVAAGVPAGVATASVLGWRLVSHWLPIAAGLVLLPTLHPREREVRPPPRRVEPQAGPAVDQEAEPR